MPLSSQHFYWCINLCNAPVKTNPLTSVCDQCTRYVDTYTFSILSSLRRGCQGHIPPWLLIRNPKHVSGEAGIRRSVYSRRMNKGKTLVCLYWNWITAFCQCSLLFGWLTAGLLYRHSSRSLGEDLSQPINRLHWEGHLRLSPEEKGKEGEAEEEKKRSSSGGSGASENQKRCVRREVKESGSVWARKGKRKVRDVTREEKKEGDEATGWGGTRTSGDRGREMRRLWFNYLF